MDVSTPVLSESLPAKPAVSLNAPVTAKAAELGEHVVRMCAAAGAGHPSSALALAHIVTCLMYKQMKYDPANPHNPSNDRLVLSEGHAVPIVYAAYADLGGAVYSQIGSKGPMRTLTNSDLPTLRDINSVLDGHPNPFEGFPFFDAATGSLGQGLSVAAGLGLAARLDGMKKKRIYCIIGDGESREGQIWEAVDFIADQQLTNVCAIFNCNNQGQNGYVSRQQEFDVQIKKLKAAGFAVADIDGHDADAILEALSKVGKGKKPVAIVARTQKGWGVDLLKDKSNHGKPLEGDAMETGIRQLIEIKNSAGAKPLADRPELPPKKTRIETNQAELPKPVWETVLAAYPADLKKAQSGKVSGRVAWGWAVRELGKLNPAIVCVDGDVGNSTYMNFFRDVFPERHFEGKIAEQNIVSAGVGLAAAGKVPFVASFAKFLARGYDQVEMAAIGRANVKLVGTHCGVTLASDGPSQMSLPDVAYFRSLASASRDGDPAHPAMVVFLVSDAVMAWKAVGILANHVGLGYLRVLRADTPILYNADTEFHVGGSHVLKSGTALTLVAHSYMVHECLKAAKLLESEGINASVVDAYSLPLDGQPILAEADKTNHKILVVEDNFAGGVHGAICEAVAASGTAYKVSALLCEKMPKSGKTPDDVLNYLGLSAAQIAEQVKTLV